MKSTVTTLLFIFSVSVFAEAASTTGVGDMIGLFSSTAKRDARTCQRLAEAERASCTSSGRPYSECRDVYENCYTECMKGTNN